MRLPSQALFSAVLSLLLLPAAHPQDAQSAPATTSAPIASYQNSIDGLRLQLQDALSAAKNHDQVKLESLVRQMEIPDIDDWFARTFGQEKSGTLAPTYRLNLAQNETQMQGVFIQFAQQSGEFFIRNVNDAPDRERAWEKSLSGLLQQPADFYFASWKNRDTLPGSEGTSIGYFVFVDGFFRWDNTMTFRAGAGGIGYPACSFCPDPEYPKGAKAKHIQGTVVLQAIIQPNGKASDIQVVKTLGPDFTEKAVAAVEKWRFKPGRDKTGQPVAVQVPIEVTFRLLN